jgi:hypothetical protein
VPLGRIRHDQKAIWRSAATDCGARGFQSSHALPEWPVRRKGGRRFCPPSSTGRCGLGQRTFCPPHQARPHHGRA